jgi:outer membrane lipoprotein-sorting protein
MKLSIQIFVLTATTVAAASAQNLNAVLSRMDASAPQFRSMTAHMERIQHVAVIDDNSTESASVRVLRSKTKDIRVALDFTKPDNKQVSINERKVEIYYPKANRVEEWDLGKYKSLVDQFILLGFGTSGKDLQKAYSLKYLKEDSAGGQKCSRIELIPKDSKVKQHYSKFELCIAESGGYPVVQKLLEPSGNYTVITYLDIKLNPDLKPESMTLTLPAGVKREYPQR